MQGGNYLFILLGVLREHQQWQPSQHCFQLSQTFLNRPSLIPPYSQYTGAANYKDYLITAIVYINLPHTGTCRER